jgi:N6-adenosine-specific RNA methylase IME4
MTKGRGINYGVGYWVRGCSEFVFIARRGHVSPPSQEGFLGLMSPNLQHSRKPDSVHVLAESLPGPYLELFARRPRDGWDTFGNEVERELPLFRAVAEASTL